MDETPGSITPPQSKYITDLVGKKDLKGNERYVPTDTQREYLEAGDYHAMSKLQASKAIESLLKLNDKPPHDSTDEVPQSLPTGSTSDDESVEPIPAAGSHPVQGLQTQGADSTQLESEVKAGHYFIVDPKDGEEKFFKVSKGSEGSRWEGRTFLEVRGGDYFYPCKSSEYRDRILGEILKDPVNAMNEYGIRLGQCGVCGRTLTAHDSRLRGIGPICAQNLMMEEAQATDEQLELLNRLGLR